MGAEQTEQNDWQEWRRLVLKGLEDLENKLEKQQAKLQGIETQLAVLNTKIMIYSAGAAFIMSIIVSAVLNYFLKPLS